eukprot:gene27011-26890_t
MTSEEGVKDSCSERVFAKIGQLPAYHPWKCITGSLLVTVAMAYGFFVVLEAEFRPDKSWVPRNALGHEHKAFVDETWPSSM